MSDTWCPACEADAATAEAERDACLVQIAAMSRTVRDLEAELRILRAAAIKHGAELARMGGEVFQGDEYLGRDAVIDAVMRLKAAVDARTL